MTNGDDLPLDAGEYPLQVDGGWGLLELSDFGRQYVQVYSLMHVLGATEGGAREERIRWAFHAFPWRGGWSSVNFFRSLMESVPNEYKPRIASIEYASPGSIKLVLDERAARQVRHIVETICATSVETADEVYRRLHTEAKELGLLRRDVKTQERFGPRESEFSIQAGETLIRIMGMRRDMDHLVRLSENNPLSLMKVLFALYRRVRVLAVLQSNGKIEF